jgi:hypothetical protein
MPPRLLREPVRNQLCGTPAQETRGGKFNRKLADRDDAPLHPPGKSTEMRTAHFLELRAWTLFVQGSKGRSDSRDSLRTIPGARIDHHKVPGMS